MPPLSQHLSHESTATLHPPSTPVFGIKRLRFSGLIEFAVNMRLLLVEHVGAMAEKDFGGLHHGFRQGGVGVNG